MGRLLSRIRNAIKKNPVLVFLSLVFFVGVAIGAIFSRPLEHAQTGIFNSLSGNTISSGSFLGFFKEFSKVFFPTFFMLICIYLLGFSAVSQPILSFIPFFRGLGLGLICGQMYLVYGFKGTGYCSLFVYPVQVIQLLIVVIAVKEALAVSKIFFMVLRGEVEYRISNRMLKIYSLKFFLLSIFLTLSALLHIILKFFLGGFVTLF